MSTGVRRQAFVDLSALVENFHRSAPAPDQALIDVRADAYGHGLVPVSRALAEEGGAAFLVSRPDDVQTLAAAGITAAIVAPTQSEAFPVVGHALYGLDSAAPRSAFRLVGEVIAVKNVPADRGVSYGYTYRTRKPTTLALVALGFADGIPRVASNRAPVRIGDFVGRVTGRIAMDQFVVDLDGNTASVGDEAVLFGDPEQAEPSLAQWADATGLAAAVIVSGLGSRIERIYP
ncbi:alanine racemase C-terminal domain-containing protein [Diaminobutyricibacter sp. McL0608]|uniref:alanine racemase C-terminal domain-containing protein n=1 Tax=Leifsonia sp. McL0608 TaxID=3143537 RepID=UPI0031F3368D